MLAYLTANQDWLLTLVGYAIAHIFPPKTFAGKLGAVVSVLATQPTKTEEKK